MHRATLRLFNAVAVKEKRYQPIDHDIYARTLKQGYVIEPAFQPSMSLLQDIEAVVGLSGEKANAAFHKSWKTIEESPLETLVMQQLVHYFTTYGFEQLDIYQEETVYIPSETLELPDIRDSIALTIVRAMTPEELIEAIIKLGSGIALAAETLDDIMTIVKANAFDSTFVDKIQNRELKAQLYEHYNLVPTEPVAYLRYVVTKLTSQSLLIKNDDLIEKIKSADGQRLDVLLDAAPSNLGSIFYRFKPLFLALKTISGKKHFFNRLRKKAIKQHTPLHADYLNDITAQIKRGNLDLDLLSKRLANASPFRKIRLAYALKYRLHADDAIVYRVRNGRGWATEFSWPENAQSTTHQALDLVESSIIGDLRRQVEGKSLYIPAHVHYTLPATEKQFTGFLPSGSYVTVPGDLIVGVHWINTQKRVDLDLSVIGASGKYGWDASYRSKKKDVLFSGDMTDAPKPLGATELFYLKQCQNEPRILMVNYFNYHAGDEVETKLLVAHEKPSRFGQNYMVDINNIIASAMINISKKQNILGLIADVNGENRVYFANISVGNAVSASNNVHSRQSRQYLVNRMVHSLDFNSLLTKAGAVVRTKKEGDEDIDLSPEHLTKTSFIELLQPTG